MPDLSRYRADFPILQRKVNGRPLAYLDNAATSQKPRPVLDAVLQYYEHSNANIHRAVHTLSDEASEAYERAHQRVAAFVGARPEELVFTRNATESINLVAYAFAAARLDKNDTVLFTEMEHHANLVPWVCLSQRFGFRRRHVRVTQPGVLDEADFEAKLAEGPALVAFTACSNVLGTLPDTRKWVRKAKDAGAVVLVDGAQAAPHLAVDVRKLGCDFYAFSGHKMLAPTGIGALYARKDLLEAMPPFLYGGDMIDRVTLERITFNRLPWKFEAGTAHITGGIGFGAAVDYLKKVGMDNIHRHEQKLLRACLQELEVLDGLTLYGPDASQRAGICSFNVDGVHPHDVATVLDQFGIAVRSGHHCGQPLMRALGIEGTARASFYLYNTEEEVARLAQALKETIRFLGKK